MPKKTPTPDTINFIPTRKDWDELYARWFKLLVKDFLKKSGGNNLVEDAVQDAFLKVSGLSANRELRDALKPMSEMGWYCFLKRQVEWILGQEREKNRKWRTGVSSITELAEKIKAIRKDSMISRDQRLRSLRRHRRLMGYLIDQEGQESKMPMPFAGLDERHCRNVVRRLVAKVCRECGISDRNRDAFMLYVLDGESPSKVVTSVWGAPSSLQELAERKNNLYVIKNRIVRRLRDFADGWQGGGHSADEFLAAA